MSSNLISHNCSKDKLNNAMSTTRCRGRREDVFSAPKFFKIIVDPTAHDLRIPAEFMKRQGRDLGNRVFLKVPSTTVSWEVELTQFNGQTLLQKGWKQFSKRYSLCFGHFLMFEYNGNSEFHVLIFDRTASEINYPDFELESEDDSILVLEHLSSQKPKPKIVQHSDTRVPESRMKRKKYGRVKKKQKTSEKEAFMAYQKAVGFAEGSTFRNPFFISIMHPTYIEATFGLEIPMSFAKGNYLPACKSSSVTLGIKNDDTKVWPTKLYSNINTNRKKLLSGWKDFVQDNGLKVGDACLFEVGNNFHWDVVIFKS